MNRILSLPVFALGLGVVSWVGLGYWGHNLLALLMTALIALVYLTGSSELLRFNRASRRLGSALQAVDDSSSEAPSPDWLAQVPAALADAVRLRLSGERRVLPGPVLTPYLVGLLVLLGMLGTFLGMVMTLDGAVQALEMSTDLQAMRSALAAPVKGLGVAFGTSVAGVAASAMLGLLSALARRERLRVSQQLERLLQGRLRPHSPTARREQLLSTLSAQTGFLPQLLERLDSLAQRLESNQQQAQAALQSEQQRFHAHSQSAWENFAQRLGEQLAGALAHEGAAAATALQDIVAQQSNRLQQRDEAAQAQLGALLQQQLTELEQQYAAARTAVVDLAGQQLAALQQAQEIAAQQQAAQDAHLNDSLARQLAALDERALQQLAAVHEGMRAQQQALSEAQQGTLDALQAAIDEQARQQLARLAEGQQQLLAGLDAGLAEWHVAQQQHQTAQQDGLQAIFTLAGEAPQAAARSLQVLKQDIHARRAEEQQQLAAQQAQLAQMQALTAELAATARSQAQASERLLDDSGQRLAGLSARFEAQLVQQQESLQQSSVEFSTGALEMGALVEAFAEALGGFVAGNAALAERLAGLEARLAESSARSDEQLAYYVSQARELIDLSLLAQQQLAPGTGGGTAVGGAS